MGVCNVCMHMLHDFTDAWNMIVCTVCPVRVVSYLGWTIMKPLLESMHTLSYFRLDTLLHSNKKIDTVSLLHSLYVSSIQQCTLHCYVCRVLECFHLHTAMPRYT